MPFWSNLWRRGWLAKLDPWVMRQRTMQAAMALILARGLVRLVRFSWWRGTLGLAGEARESQQADAIRLARHVERAASRLPGTSRCLPKAVALSRLLRARGVPHRVVLAIRPKSRRGGADDLHAWVTSGNRTILGELPGPWLTVLDLPDARSLSA